MPLERALEGAASRGRRIRRAIDPLQVLVWSLALVPLLIVPPLMAMFVAWRYDKRRPGRMDATWPTIVALLNLTVSVVLIIRFEAQLADSLSWLAGLWRGPAKLPAGVQSI